MRDILKPGGIPHSALNAFADLFGRLGPVRGVDYTLGAILYHLVTSAGFVMPAWRSINRPFARAKIGIC